MASHTEYSVRTNNPYPASTRTSALLPASERNACRRRLPESLPTSTPQGPAADHSAMQGRPCRSYATRRICPNCTATTYARVTPGAGQPPPQPATAVIVSLGIITYVTRGRSGWERLSECHV